MLDTTLTSLSGLPNFVVYLGSAGLLIALFLTLYLYVTPYRELELIRKGNNAAAISLGGTLIGMCLALASAISHSAGLLDMLIWGLVALLVQLVVYRLVCWLMPDLNLAIHSGRVAPGILLGACSVAAGIINAACMSS